MTPELEAKLAGRRVVASVSGGKDSAALSLWLTEQGIEHDRVFMDTGWEHPDTYAYLRGPLTEKIGAITELRAPRDMVQLVVNKGMFPSRQRRFCTEELKVFPMQRYLRSLVDGGADLVNAVGIRAAESKARSRLGEWEWSDGFDCEVWRPLIRWSEQDVIDIHARHALRPNPLYLRGATRVGCFPCIMANKAEIRLIADTAPEHITKVRELEAAVAVAARARYERDRAEWLESPDTEPVPGTDVRNEDDEEDDTDYGFAERHARWEKKKRRLESPFVAPSWFQNPRGRTGMMPIDDVVAWSRTSRGGSIDHVELFAAGPNDAGCMRWGMCDTNASEDKS